MRVPTYFSALPPLSGRSRAVAVHPEINPWSQSMVSLGVPAPNFVGLWLQLNQPPPAPRQQTSPPKRGGLPRFEGKVVGAGVSSAAALPESPGDRRRSSRQLRRCALSDFEPAGGSARVPSPRLGVRCLAALRGHGEMCLGGCVQ